MNEQDDFANVIAKYNLWKNTTFFQAMPEQVNQEQEYNNMLDECGAPVGGHCPTYWDLSIASYSKLLKHNDEVAYRCGFADYTDTLREQYFERNDEEFYPVEGTREAINEALEELADAILNAQL